METTRINTDIGRIDNGSGVVHLLSGEMQLCVADLLRQLKSELGDAIWIMPHSSLHITLCELYEDKDYGEDKEALFRLHRAQYDTAMREVLASRHVIPVMFNQIEASPDAIILRGSDDKSFEAIRSQLITTLPIPAETKQPPTIVHSTIARFVREVDLAMVQAAVAKLSVSFVENVSEFQIVHNCSPHMLKYEVAATHPLHRMCFG